MPAVNEHVCVYATVDVFCAKWWDTEVVKSAGGIWSSFWHWFHFTSSLQEGLSVCVSNYPGSVLLFYSRLVTMCFCVHTSLALSTVQCLYIQWCFLDILPSFWRYSMKFWADFCVYYRFRLLFI